MVESPRQELEERQRNKATRHQEDGYEYDVPHGGTPDELAFPRHAASFHKLLQHEPAGTVSGGLPVGGLLTDSGPDNGMQNYKDLVEGLDTAAPPSSDFDSAKLDNLKLQNRTPKDPSNPGGPRLRPRVLIDPRASKALSMEGADSVSLDVSGILYGAPDSPRLLNEISFSSEETAAEIIELYAMALLRGFQLGTYGAAPDANLAVAALNSFGAKYVWGYDAGHNPITAKTRLVTTQNLFRGPTAGDLSGDYLSVFLTLPRPPLFPSGCAPDVATLIGASQFAGLLGEPLLVPLGIDQYFGITFDDFVDLQNAKVPVPYPPGFFTGRTPIATGRDIGNYVHVDSAYEEHIRAVDILIGNQVPTSRNSPYSDKPPPSPYENEGNGPTLGPPDAWGLVGAVRIAAERSAFAQKWLIHRRARPEVLAGLIHLAMNGNTDLEGKLPAILFTQPEVRDLLDRVNQDNQSRGGGQNNYLCRRCFPRAHLPTHPGHPTMRRSPGHASRRSRRSSMIAPRGRPRRVRSSSWVKSSTNWRRTSRWPAISPGFTSAVTENTAFDSARRLQSATFRTMRALTESSFVTAILVSR